jgi:hypothetical protein
MGYKQVFDYQNRIPVRLSRLAARRQTMKNKQIYVERRSEGDYAVRQGGAQRASAVEPTQAQVIERAREMHPGAPIHVERVRDTAVGGRDKWRKP